MNDIFDGVYNAGRNAGYTHEVAKSLADKAVKTNSRLLLSQVAKNLNDLVVMKSQHWISTEKTGSHILVDENGNVIAGAGGKLKGKTFNNIKTKSKDTNKKDTPKQESNSWTKNSYGVKVNNTEDHKQELLSKLQEIKTGENITIKHSDGRESTGVLQGYDHSDQHDGSRNIIIKTEDGRIKGLASFVIEDIKKKIA